LFVGFKYKLLHEEDQFTLAVLGVETSDAGRYECKATNEVGSCKSSANLQVDSKLQNLVNHCTVLFVALY